MKNHWLQSKVKASNISIKVDNRILEEQGKNSATFKARIKEAINNSIDSALRFGLSSLTVIIRIGYSFSSQENNYIEIEDNAAGMDMDSCARSLCPGARPPVEGLTNGLSEHGLGVNNFIAGVGKLKFVVSKLKDEKAILVEDYRLGDDIPVYYTEWDADHGTLWRIENLKEESLKFDKKLEASRSGPSQVINKLCMELGADYRYYLANNKKLGLEIYRPSLIDNTNLDLTIKIEQIDIDKGETQEKVVESIWPLYCLSDTRENKPHVEKIRFAQGLQPNEQNHIDKDGNQIIPKWEVWASIGFGPFMEDVESEKKFTWHHPFNNKAGFDVFINGVSILNTYNSAAASENKRVLNIDFHGMGNSFTKIRGELHISLPSKELKFETTATKDGVLPMSNWLEFTAMFSKWLVDSKMIEEAPKKSNKEFDACDKIYDFFRRMIGDAGSPLGLPVVDVVKGYTSNLPGYPIDITVVCKDDKNNSAEPILKNFIFEGKAPGVAAGGADVIQPVAYYLSNPRKFEKTCFLVAENLTPQGQDVLDGIEKELSISGIKVIWHTLEKYGI